MFFLTDSKSGAFEESKCIQPADSIISLDQPIDVNFNEVDEVRKSPLSVQCFRP